MNERIYSTRDIYIKENIVLNNIHGQEASAEDPYK